MSTETISNNQRIAKNTLMLYFRMILTMVVGLYTSRVVLNTLGVEDYGIYGVVGGIVAMMGFLNSSMSGATSRFITFELGRGNFERLAKTFSSALIVHIIIALIVFFVSETFGLWFLCSKLVIPEGRMAAAHIVYQLSILSAMFTITQVPYNASIISHEKMDVYAYVEILNVTLKLLIVYLLVIGNFDKLILYAILMLAVTVIVMMVYRIYCIRHFSECCFLWVYDKDFLMQMLSFSGWDLYGNFAGVARQQGVNIIINMFFGPILNAASSIATTVSGVIMQFASNVVLAIKPQIIKTFAKNEFERTTNLIMMGSKINYFLLSLLSIPLICEMDYVLLVWLKVVPDYAVIFCQLSLVYNIIANQSYVVVVGVHASGKIKNASLMFGTLYLLVLPLTYIYFCIDTTNPWIPYLLNILVVFGSLVINSVVFHKQLPNFSPSKYILLVVVKYIIPFIAIYYTVAYISLNFEKGFSRLIISTLTSTIVLIVISYFYILNRNERMMLITLIKRKMAK